MKGLDAESELWHQGSLRCWEFILSTAVKVMHED